MTTFAIRIFIFTLLPLLLAGTVILFDTAASSRVRRLEATLIFLFAISVAGNGISSFFGHFFLSDIVAASVGWPSGSPFQLEMGFANLTIGVPGLVAVRRRDGFREATVIAVTVLSVGATIVHVMDIIETGNLAPGNTIQNTGNLLRPALLITFIIAARRAEAGANGELDTPEFKGWMAALRNATGPVTALVAAAFGLGFFVDRSALATLLGAVGATIIVFIVLALSPWHQVRWRR